MIDPSLEGILAPTYGIMLYQEQVMQVAQTFAGFSLGKADILRRAMGKKRTWQKCIGWKMTLSKGLSRLGTVQKKAKKVFAIMEKICWLWLQPFPCLCLLSLGLPIGLL